MAKKRFDDANMAEPGVMSESSMLNFDIPNISFGGGDTNIFGESNSLYSKDDIITEADPAELIPYEGNPMNMDEDDNWKALKLSIEETGVWRENPIVVELRDDGKKMVLAGHRRTMIATQLKLNTVPVIYKKFKSDEERRRFIDASNIHRDPKLIDILNRYEFNAKLYDEGYWKDKTVGQKAKIDCVSTIIGYPASKMHNILFLLDIKKSHPQIINLIDDEVVVTSDLRNLTKMHNQNKIYNYFDVLKRLCEDITVNDKEEDLKVRKSKAKEIIADLEMRGRNKNPGNKKKTTYEEVVSLGKKVDKLFASSETLPTTEKQKSETLAAIDNIMEKLTKYREKVKTDA